MNLKTTLVAASILILPFTAGSANAMTIDDFAAMNNDDDATYVALLVEAAAHMFKANGQPDQAAKAIAYFKDSSSNGGVHQLATYLKMKNAQNKRNAINPNNRAPVYQVEDAMELAFKDAGLIVPAKFLLDSGKDFHPSGPPRAFTTGP
jgi:hypothetical protein